MFDRAEYADTCIQRANIIEWLPFEKGQSVVIHSSAPSAVLDMLRDREVSLQIMSELQIEKLGINPAKGSLDYIVLLGMEVDARILSGLYKKLKPEGRLVVLLHNRYGMSYLAGKPARPQQYYTAVENGNAGKSAFYNYSELERLFQEAGVNECYRYYADPEGAFATNIYSDEFLPKPGDCNLKARNFTYDRMAMFDEAAALDVASRGGMFPIFANDYLIITGERLPQLMIRYSNDRAQDYRIRTEICRGEEIYEVRKVPLTAESVAHVSAMERTYQMLCEQYDEGAFRIVPCMWTGRHTVFPFVAGISLSQLMANALQKKDLGEVFALFHTFLNKLRSCKGGQFSNYDFIFSNILIDGDQWQVIDYEWTVNRAVSAEELAFRAAYCFSLEHRDFPFEDICCILDYDGETVRRLISQETSYQQNITGGQPSVEMLCHTEGGDVYHREELLRALELSVPDHVVQIYADTGRGFSEEQSYFVEHTLTRYNEMDIHLKVSAGMKALRIDPCEEPCLVQIKKLLWNGSEVFLDKSILVNGVKGKSSKAGYGEYVFATKDPNITIPLDKLPDVDASQNELRVQMEIHKLSLQLANTLTKSMKRII